MSDCDARKQADRSQTTIVHPIVCLCVRKSKQVISVAGSAEQAGYLVFSAETIESWLQVSFMTVEM